MDELSNVRYGINFLDCNLVAVIEMVRISDLEENAREAIISLDIESMKISLSELREYLKHNKAPIF